MKTRFINIGLFVILFLVSCTSTKSLTETAQKVTQNVQSKDFTISVNYANPFRCRQIPLTSEYDLKVRNDSAFAYLPYFGVAYVAPYGTSEGGIKFSEPMKEYSILPNKKNNGWDIHFKVSTKEYQYEFFVNIFNNGSSTFSVNSFQRDQISFSGEMKF